MTIYFLSRGVPDSEYPQWGNFEYEQAEILSSAGHNIVILSVDTRFVTYRHKLGLSIKKHTPNITSYTLTIGPLNLLGKIFDNLQQKICARLMLGLFKKVINCEKFPDIIYAHYLNIMYSAVYIKDRYNVKAIGLEHWSELGKKKPPRTVVKRSHKVYPKLDRLLVVSSYLRDNILKYIGIESYVIPNIIGKEFRYLNKSRNDGKIKFVSVGNLFPIKKMDLIINSVANISPELLANINITIIGGGPECRKLKNLIREYNLEGIVYLLGRKGKKDIANILNDSDVYILASESETFGVAAAEALACGLPVISTECGGPRDFISSNNGIFIPVNNREELTKAILYMIGHYKEYNKKSIAENYFADFSQEAIGNKLCNIFKNVIENG